MPDHDPWFLQHRFSYIMVPKDLYRNSRYQMLSTEAKMLYGFFMDRSSLSYRNGPDWVDENGDIYIIFRQEEICQRLNCGHDKAAKILKELESAKLIRRYSPHRGAASRIVLLPFEPVPKQGDSQTRPEREKRPVHSGKTAPNNPESNNSDINKPDFNMETAERKIKENISYEMLRETIPESILDTIVSVMTQAVCSEKPTEEICGRVWNREELRKHLMNLDDMHIQYVYDLFKSNTQIIQYPRRYFLARLSQADPGSMDAFYTSWVNRDRRAGAI